MSNQFTRGDSLYEYLTGAASDGGAQADPAQSLGGFRSSTEAVSLGISYNVPGGGFTVLGVGGGNSVGFGTIGVGSSHPGENDQLLWTAPGGAPGSFVTFTPGATLVIEGSSPSQFIRVQGTPPFHAPFWNFAPGNCYVSPYWNNFFGFNDIGQASSLVGENQYRASIIRNESAGSVSSFQRWISTLGTRQTSDKASLSGSGSGSIGTSGSFADWPRTGWCRIQSAAGSLKEIVYYANRTNSALNIATSGRGLLGTSPTAGSATDLVDAVPGVAIGLDPGGIQAFGDSIQSVANQFTPPTGIVWNYGLTASTGLQIGTLAQAKQVGFWMWRHVPADNVMDPGYQVRLSSSFAPSA